MVKVGEMLGKAVITNHHGRVPVVDEGPFHPDRGNHLEGDFSAASS